MQAGKNAVASAKETASNIGASAVSGKEKTKATVQGQVEKIRAHDPAEKEIAEQRTQEKKEEAEINKVEARHANAAVKEQTRAGGHHPTTGAVTGHGTGGGHVPGTGTGSGAGTGTGTNATTTPAYNPLLGGATNLGGPVAGGGGHGGYA